MKYKLSLLKESNIHNLTEYMAKSKEELIHRNTVQAVIWRQLTNLGFVDKSDMDMFRKFATYFNDFRDEHGYDLDIDIILNDLSFLKKE